MTLFPVTLVTHQAPGGVFGREDLPYLLLNDARQWWRSLADRNALGDLWRCARDLVLATERWSHIVGGMRGEEKMELVLNVAWSLVQEQAGTAKLRNRLIGALDLVLPGAVARQMVRWLVTDAVVRGAVRFVLELAVREMWEITEPEEPHV